MVHSPPTSSYTRQAIAYMHTLDLTGQLVKLEPYSFACGEYANVYKADWVGKYSTNPVAVKVPKVLKPEDLDRRIRREIRIWSKLGHANITPLLGICYDFGRPSMPCLVSPYYHNGNINKFLRQRPNVDKLALLIDISSALSYLHSMYVVHGNVKGSNILINDSCKASLVDFGRSRVLQTSKSTAEAVSASGHFIAPEIDANSEQQDFNPVTTEGWRWMAPELMGDCLDEPEQSIPRVTMATDSWAFAMTVVEVVTGSIPFSHIKNDASVIMFISSGGRPKRELCPQINNEIWEMLEMCWHVVPNWRPSMATLSHFLALQMTAERARL